MLQCGSMLGAGNGLVTKAGTRDSFSWDIGGEREGDVSLESRSRNNGVLLLVLFPTYGERWWERKDLGGDKQR